MAGPVILRKRTKSDVDALGEATRSSWPELAAWFPWANRELDDREQMQRALDAENAFSHNRDFEFVIVESANDVVVGSLRLNPRAASGAAGIGYWVRTDRTGRGYATAATWAATGAAFDYLAEIDRVLIQMDVANLPSAAIARKVGFRLEEEFELPIEAPARTGRGYLWAMTRGNWDELQAVNR